MPDLVKTDVLHAYTQKMERADPKENIPINKAHLYIILSLNGASTKKREGEIAKTGLHIDFAGTAVLSFFSLGSQE